MSSPPAITSDTPISNEPQAPPTTEPAPAPAPAPHTGCKGYLMAHHVHPPPSGTTIDPYAVVPCPHPTAVPPHLGERCRSNPHASKRTCGKCMYCPMHWCGFCKRAVKAAQIAALAGEKTQVQEVQLEEVRPEGEALKVKTD